MTDLLTGEPFTKKDIVTIQDPADMASRLIDVDAVRKNMAALTESGMRVLLLSQTGCSLCARFSRF